MKLNLTQVQKLAESLMTDECTIQRPGRPETTVGVNWNETTGTYDPLRVPLTTVYEGPCMLYRRGINFQVVTEGGEVLNKEQFYLSLPLSLVADIAILPEDVVTVIDVGESTVDETTVGLTFAVDTVDKGTIMATREVMLKRLEAQVP